VSKNLLILSSKNEQTKFIFGYSLKYRLLLVVFMEKNQRNRIISARPATRYEQSSRLYFKN
jgi:uncharacterized DUF497 family protein